MDEDLSTDRRSFLGGLVASLGGLLGALPLGRWATREPVPPAGPTIEDRDLVRALELVNELSKLRRKWITLELWRGEPPQVTIRMNGEGLRLYLIALAAGPDWPPDNVGTTISGDPAFKLFYARARIRPMVIMPADQWAFELWEHRGIENGWMEGRSELGQRWNRATETLAVAAAQLSPLTAEGSP